MLGHGGPRYRQPFRRPANSPSEWSCSATETKQGSTIPKRYPIQESYNCATWLKHMLDEGVVRPDRLIVFGISDYPTAAMRQDPRLSRYVGAYRAFEEAGVTFVTKEEIRQKGVRGTLVPLLDAMAADRLYVSLDADIGSLDAVHAARFMNVVGLNSEELYEIARVIGEALEEKELIGIDVCGIETFLLGREFPNGSTDRTLERLSDFVRILFGHEASISSRRTDGGIHWLKVTEGFPLEPVPAVFRRGRE